MTEQGPRPLIELAVPLPGPLPDILRSPSTGAPLRQKELLQGVPAPDLLPDHLRNLDTGLPLRENERNIPSLYNATLVRVAAVRASIRALEATERSLLDEANVLASPDKVRVDTAQDIIGPGALELHRPGLSPERHRYLERLLAPWQKKRTASRAAINNHAPAPLFQLLRTFYRAKLELAGYAGMEDEHRIEASIMYGVVRHNMDRDFRRIGVQLKDGEADPPRFKISANELSDDMYEISGKLAREMNKGKGLPVLALNPNGSYEFTPNAALFEVDIPYAGEDITLVEADGRKTYFDKPGEPKRIRYLTNGLHRPVHASEEEAPPKTTVFNEVTKNLADRLEMHDLNDPFILGPQYLPNQDHPPVQPHEFEKTDLIIDPTSKFMYDAAQNWIKLFEGGAEPLRADRPSGRYSKRGAAAGGNTLLLVGHEAVAGFYDAAQIWLTEDELDKKSGLFAALASYRENIQSHSANSDPTLPYGALVGKMQERMEALDSEVEQDTFGPWMFAYTNLHLLFADKVGFFNTLSQPDNPVITYKCDNSFQTSDAKPHKNTLAHGEVREALLDKYLEYMEPTFDALEISPEERISRWNNMVTRLSESYFGPMPPEPEEKRKILKEGRTPAEIMLHAFSVGTDTTPNNDDHARACLDKARIDPQKKLEERVVGKRQLGG